jgi:hypothetical protein
MSRKINFKKEDIKSFLESLSKISDTAIVNITSDNMYAISSSDDRSMFLWAKLESEFEEEAILNLPSVKKLSKALGLVGDNVEFTLNSNNLEYTGERIKFKYHLFDNGILVAPKLTLSKIESLQYEFEFSVNKSFLIGLLKQASIFKDTNKLYIFTNDGKLYWSLADKTMTNSDVLTVEGSEVDFELEEDFIINMDNLQLLHYGSCETLDFSINKMGIGKIGLKNGNVELNYIISSLTR